MRTPYAHKNTANGAITATLCAPIVFVLLLFLGGYCFIIKG